jgi:uncharacterized protein YndB with AHSA1/START domain
MSKVIFGNHSSVIVPRKDREGIRKFYCDVLGGVITQEDPERDFLRLGDNFFIGFLYGDVPDVSESMRRARALWLEIKSDDVEEMGRKITECSLVTILEVPDPHLYFQVPGGQVLRLVGIDEDLSFYEGTGAGPDVKKVKEGAKKQFSENQTMMDKNDNKSKNVPASVFSYMAYIRATPEKLWDTLTTNELWNRCWMGSRFESDWKVGSQWRAISQDGILFDSGEVLESVPRRRLVLKWINEWRPEFKTEGYSLCTYEMEPIGTSVKFTITLSMERSDSKFIANVSGAWPMVVSNLKSLLETGEIALVDNPRHKH